MDITEQLTSDNLDVAYINQRSSYKTDFRGRRDKRVLKILIIKLASKGKK